jgi:hypothetical protein
MKGLKRLSIVSLGVVIFVLALSVMPASAHSVAFAWDFGGTCNSITLYLATYHFPSTPVGGVLLNGTRYNFTGIVEDLPPGVDGSTPFDWGYNESSVNWQTVTVSGLAEGTYSVMPTSDTATESPSAMWPQTVTISCPAALKAATSGGYDPDLFYNPDDRINHAAWDRAAPVAIYCKDVYEHVQIWKIDFETGRGYSEPTINMSYGEVEAFGVSAKKNILIAEKDGVQLWRLTTGQLQVNVLYPNEFKWYIYLWDDCPASVDPTDRYTTSR